MTVTVYIIDEQGATFVFYDQVAAIRCWHEEREDRGIEHIVYYTGTIPIERAGITASGLPDDSTAEYVAQTCEPPPAARALIDTWD